MTLPALAFLALAMCTSTARAEASAHHPTNDQRGSRLFPGALASQIAREAALADGLERQLELLSGVVRARVTWTEPNPVLVPLDQPVPSAQVRVVLETAYAGPKDADLEGVLLALRGNGGQKQPSVQLTRVAAPLAAQEALAVPQRETNESPARSVLACSLAANVLLATVLLWRMKKRG